MNNTQRSSNYYLRKYEKQYPSCVRQLSNTYASNLMPILISYPSVSYDRLLTILQVGAHGSSPEFLPVDQETMSSSLVYFISRTAFKDVVFPFTWLAMSSSHLIIDLPLGLFTYISNFNTTIIVDSSSVLMTWPNYRHLFLLIT